MDQLIIAVKAAKISDLIFYASNDTRRIMFSNFLTKVKQKYAHTKQNVCKTLVYF